MKYLLLSFVFSCLFTLSEQDKERIVPIQQVKFYEDTTNQLTFDQIRQNPDLLSFNAGFSPADYQKNIAYWVYYDFCISNADQNYIFEFYDQTIDEIEIFIKNESDPEFKRYVFGDQYPFIKRSVNHKNFQIKLNKTGQYEAYARIVNREYADIRVAIRTVDRFIGYSLMEYFLYGIFYGMILIVSLYNVFIYTAIREIKYIYYTLYILSVGIFAMGMDGIAYQMLWPNAPGWNQIAHGVSLFSLIAWSIIFSRRFLRLPVRAPKIDHLLLTVFGLRIVFFFYALFFDQSLFDYRFVEILPLAIIFYGGLQVFSRGYKPARYFIVAYGFLFLGFIFKALVLFSIVPVSWTTYNNFTQIFSYYSLHLCFLLEMLFLSLALSDRVRILKENKDRAFRRVVVQHEESIRYKDKLNAQLEGKVKLRTQEIEEKNELLQETNEMLERQKREISEINSLLDLDNWKLRNDLKAIQAERLINRILTYRDFQQVFPSRESCLHFLADNKWKDGYECAKCQNTKFHEVDESVGRRCTKCGYVETPTVNTVFHGLRFPLDKALYILYLYLNNDNRSLSEISEEIQLRKNTIWSFKKKIKEYVSQHGIANLEIFNSINLQLIED